MYRKGFAPIVAVIAIAVVLIAAGAYVYLHQSAQKKGMNPPAAISTVKNQTTTSAAIPSASNAASTVSTSTSTPAEICKSIIKHVLNQINGAQYQISIIASAGTVRLVGYDPLGNQFNADTGNTLDATSNAIGDYCLEVIGTKSEPIKVNVGIGGKFISGTTGPGVVSIFKITVQSDGSLAISLVSDGGASTTISNVETISYTGNGNLLSSSSYAEIPPDQLWLSQENFQKATATTTFICPTGSHSVLIPTSSVISSDPGWGVYYHPGGFCFDDAPYNAASPDVIINSSKQWLAKVEWAPMFYGHTNEGSLTGGFTLNDMYIAMRNLQTGVSKEIGIIGFIPKSNLDGFKNGPSDMYVYAHLIGWSTDGNNLWGALGYLWEGDDRERTLSFAIFKLNIPTWKVTVYENAPFDPYSAYFVTSSFNLDRGIVSNGDMNLSLDQNSTATNSVATGTIDYSLYNLDASTTTELHTYNLPPLQCVTDFGWVPTTDCTLPNRNETFSYPDMLCGGQDPNHCESLSPQWIDSSTISWVNPLTGKVVTSSIQALP